MRPASRRQLEQQLVEYSHRLHAAGWVANHDGNLTAELEPGRYLATPTSTSKAAVRAESLIVVDADGKLVSGTGNPFGELALHLVVYRTRPDVKAVLHAHPPAATGLSVAGLPVRTTLLAEPVVSLGASIPLVPYAAPKTPAWTAGLAAELDDADVLVLQNHGVIAVGPDLETAFLRMELCEHLAKIQLAAAQAGQVREIPATDVPGLLAARTKAGIGKAARQKTGTKTVESTPPKTSIQPPAASDARMRSVIREELEAVLRGRG